MQHHRRLSWKYEAVMGWLCDNNGLHSQPMNITFWDSIRTNMTSCTVCICGLHWGAFFVCESWDIITCLCITIPMRWKAIVLGCESCYEHRTKVLKYSVHFTWYKQYNTVSTQWCEKHWGFVAIITCTIVQCTGNCLRGIGCTLQCIEEHRIIWLWVMIRASRWAV